jgi:8-oxo-dGTP pyrophosphatase MutT (NUDIX family)
MQEELARFIATGTRLLEETARWGPIPLEITYYRGNEPAPLAYVSSVRAMVFRDRSLLVVKEANGHLYIVPGGRVERGETTLETLRREVLEETGWTLLRAEPLGFMHLHHVGPRPERYEYPYPDFVWPIYLAEAGHFTPGAIVPDDYVMESEFMPVDEVRNLTIGRGERLLFEEALRLRASPKNVK